MDMDIVIIMDSTYHTTLHSVDISFCLHIFISFQIIQLILHLKIKINLHNYHDDCAQHLLTPFLQVIGDAALQYPGGCRLLLKYITHSHAAIFTH